VKNVIKKFNYSLIHTEFLIEMDMKAFPKMIQINAKIIPNTKILRWPEWFSPYKFQVKYLKGKDNILAYIPSRPEEFSKRFSPAKMKSKQQRISHIFRFSNVPGTSSLKPTDHPPELFNLMYPFDPSIIMERRTYYELQVFRQHGGSILKPYGVNP